MNKYSKALLFIYFGFWISYFLFFWSQSITFDTQGNLVANHVNIWGDWAAHFTMGSRMAFDQLITQQSPFVINHSFSYPFIADLISAVLIRVGLSFFNAFIIPSFLFSIATVWALFYFYQKIFKSKLTAIIASLLFLLNGGLGFIYYIQDIFQSSTPWKTVFSPPQQYTNIEPLFYRWISVIDSMIIPQRAFALGFPLALVALTWCFSIFLESKKTTQINWRKFLIPILILGFMPLIHTHSFLAAFIILLSWSVGDLIIKKFDRSQLKKWFYLVAGVSLIAMPMIKIFLFSQVSNRFIKWFPGWYSFQHPDQNWLVFWIKNWGLIPLLATLGLVVFLKNQKKDQKKLSVLTIFLPFFILFALVNLFLFQPFIWDNTKLLAWCSVGFSGLAAYFLVSMWQKKRKRSFLARILISILFIISIFAGTIDAFRAIRFDLHSHIMYSAEEMALADWAKDQTEPNSIWLTGDNHNHWLFNLTGRQALMTYRGWLWTHGYETRQLQTDITKMFADPIRSQILFEKYQVDYIVIGPNEKRVWGASSINFDFLKLVKSSPNYQIYSY